MALIDQPGAIVFASGDLSRYAAFEDCLLGLEKPKGTVSVRGYASDLVSNLNSAIARAREQLPNLGWIWVIADDHSFKSDTLSRLLRHNMDVVSPLVLVRRYPFPPSIYLRQRDHETNLFQQLALEALPTDRTLMVSGEDGMPEMYSSPAGMLISRRALDAVGTPVYRAGQMGNEGFINEDFDLCERLHLAGFRPATDLSIRMSHITPAEIWPVLADGRWKIDLRFRPYDTESM
ncbi:MAG: hypothetical protein IT349_19345 [Candidatus Eisenbacteria bacterium]|nr:hypothetical protein [Candidatus Eisenbacteria bacterium]